MEYNRVKWASRRGMLELDLVLQPFVENAYLNLGDEEQILFQKLLEEQDNDLFSWFLNQSEPESAELQRIVAIIREYTCS